MRLCLRQDVVAIGGGDFVHRDQFGWVIVRTLQTKKNPPHFPGGGFHLLQICLCLAK